MSDSLSQCGLSCLGSALPSTNCGGIANTTCLCSDQIFNTLVTNCVLSNCSIGEQLSVKIFTSRNCNVTVFDRSGQVGLLQAALTPVQDVLFLLRMANRIFHIAPWGADDTTIVMAWLLQNGFLGGGIVASRLGIGRDVWGLDEASILKIVKLFLAFEVLYIVTLGIIKISICFFFMRLFTDQAIRRYLWATQTFNILLAITFVTVNLNQCKPLSWFWNRLDENTTETGICLNINAMSWAHATVNIALDVWMIALPATQIWGLQMAMGKKLHVLAMFAMGALSVSPPLLFDKKILSYKSSRGAGFSAYFDQSVDVQLMMIWPFSLTLISCIRLKSLIAFAKTQNPTQDFYDVALWSAIELTTGVVVACLPANRQTLARYAPNLRTMVSKYTSKVSVGGDWTMRSNVKSNNVVSRARANDNATEQRRPRHQRSRDEIAMSDYSQRHADHARHVSPDDLSRADSRDPTELALSAYIGLASFYIEANTGQETAAANMDRLA